MKTLKFITSHFYHIYNRGTDGRDIFKTDNDYLRFIHSLYEFNDKQFALPHGRGLRKETISKNMARQPLVNILCFCLMPNHFHLVLQQITEAGITRFMRKLGTGYTMYFNIKYKRNGVLFQGQFKALPVETDEYLLHLSRYIHLNPIELREVNWKEEGIRNWYITERFLKEYRWSSFLDYIGITNFPSVICKDFIQRYFKDYIGYKRFVENFLVKDIVKTAAVVLEG